ncbi:MAG: GatB/YqeY domain-containing protein, partial [Clostridia bacterium]|nr:GatB/YqeY domain-containing protein [Clostridia bacterium]
INKLMLAGIEKKAAGEEMTDEDTTRIMQKTINELTEEREGFVKAGRAETVASLDNQLATIKKYLPKMLSEEEIKGIILSLPDKTTPFVMKHFKSEYAGKVDMRLVGAVLKTL